MTSSASTIWQRITFACSSLVMAIVLLWPGAAPPRHVTWEDLLFPLVPGAIVTRGYLLSSPRRGEEHDIVVMVRRDDPNLGPPSYVEVHIVNRGQWPDIRETKSFGVGYETPRSRASTEDLEAVAETIANHLRANDIGFSSVDGVPLVAEPSPPWITRALERTTGLRGALILVLVGLSLGFVASLPRHGDAAVATLIFVLGLGLRLPHLDVPFTHDQDVQRFFTGQSSLMEILTGNGLQDRHPPLWFVVLHIAGLFGQTETIARFPAVISGAAIGPAIIWATHRVRGRSGISGALCGFVAAVSPVLILRSREVSEIPFFSVLVIVAVALTLRLSNETSRASQHALTIITALLAWTYYLAPLVLLGIVVPLALARQLRRNVLVALGWGALGGAPAFLLGAWTIVRDHGARSVAAQFPELAWGQRSMLETLVEQWDQARNSVGVPIIFVAVFSALAAWRSRRDVAPFVALNVVFTTALGIAIAATFARVQPYYLVSTVPVLLLAVSFGPSNHTKPNLWTLICAACSFAFAHAAVPANGLVYLPDADAFMPRFASFVLKRSEERVIVVAHYDATLLAYYVERIADGRSRWPDVGRPGEFVLPASRRRVLPLARAHELNEESARQAREKLTTALAEGAALVIERDGFVLPEVHAELGRCDTLLMAPTARLLACPAR